MLLRMDESTTHFLRLVKGSMEAYFGNDQGRIEHALQVTAYARELLQYIDSDPLLTLTAAYLHDIGIPEAERKYGQCTGKQQELEGPPVARGLLHELGADEELIATVCALVAHHHTQAGINSPEFRILWDADALVNLAESLTGKTKEQVEQILERSMVTEAGYLNARKLYL